MSPRGERFRQARAREWAAGPGLVILCPRFEGVDERVIEARGLTEVSIGDYVLSGGEIAALAILDACVRLIPGVMGKDELGSRGELRARAARISPLYPPARMGGPHDSGHIAFGRSREDCCLASLRSRAHHARETPGLDGALGAPRFDRVAALFSLTAPISSAPRARGDNQILRRPECRHGWKTHNS